MMLKHFAFAKKATPLSMVKAEQILAIHEASHELKQIQNGKLKGISAQN